MLLLERGYEDSDCKEEKSISDREEHAGRRLLKIMPAGKEDREVKAQAINIAVMKKTRNSRKNSLPKKVIQRSRIFYANCVIQ